MDSCYENLLFPRDGGNYKKYLNELYNLFKNEILNANLHIKNLPLHFRTYQPSDQELEEIFYHLTCRDYTKENKHKFPDFKRSERIRLINPIIKNFLKCEECLFNNCNGILIWEEVKNDANRIHLYLQEESYIIVLEKRITYYLLITAFYVDYDKTDYYIDKYHRYKIEIDDV